MIKVASLFSLILATSASAAPIDQFRCRMSFDSLTPVFASQTIESDLVIVRSLPAPESSLDGEIHPTSGLSFAQGRLDSRRGDGLRMTIDLEYWHSSTLAPDGRTLRAGMLGCLAPSYGLNQPLTMTRCDLPRVSPRNPLEGFSPVEVQLGVPAIQPTLLEEKTIEVPEGKFRYSCQFIQTLTSRP